LSTDHPVQRRGPARWLPAAAVVLVAACFAVTLRAQWRAVAGASWRVEPGTLVVATLALAVSFGLVAGLWGVALRSATALPLRRGLRIWFLANLARYVPGNVWSFVGAVELARRDGASRRATVGVMALTQVLSVGAAVVVGLPVLIAQGARLGRSALLAGALLAAGLVLLAVLGRPAGRLLRRRYPDVRLADLMPGAGLATGLILGYLLYWLVVGVAFGAFAASLYPPAGQHLAIAVAGFAAAYAAGFLSLVTPGGLGVREGVLVLVLTSVVPAGVAVVIAVLARVWMMLAELVGAVVTALLARRRRPAAGA
jgi:uncharacterized membrane protein YbhN (UPF0104 family)